MIGKRMRHFAVMTLALAMAVDMIDAVGATAVEPLMILASPSVKAPLEALGYAFESIHPNVRVKLHYETALQMRQMIAAMQSTGRHHIESGVFHLIAPAGTEIITRMEQKYYVLPGTRRSYATAHLVLVVPATLVEAPSSFEELGRNSTLRVAIVDPKASETGRVTEELLERMDLADALKDRLDIAHDSSGVLDHIMHGQADVGIVRNTEVSRHKDRIRVAVEAPPGAHSRIVYEIAMERFCPNRQLCQEFLAFTQSPEAQAVLRQLGYRVPTNENGAQPSPNAASPVNGNNTPPSQ